MLLCGRHFKGKSELFDKWGYQLKTWLVLLLGIVCIAISAIFVKSANVNGLASAFYRIVFALLIITPIYFFHSQKNAKLKYKVMCAIGGIFFGCELAFWNMAIIYSSATIPTLLVNISSVWVGIGALLILKEKIHSLHWIGNAIALTGVVVVIGVAQFSHFNFSGGNFLAIIASIFLAIYTLMVKKARSAMSTIDVLFFTCLGSLLPLALACVIFNVQVTGFSIDSWLCLVGLGLITQIGGYFAINYSLGHLPSNKVSVAILLQPVLTAVFAAWLINENIGTSTIYGGLIVIFGLAISFVNAKRIQRNLSQLLINRKSTWLTDDKTR